MMKWDFEIKTKEMYEKIEKTKKIEVLVHAHASDVGGILYSFLGPCFRARFIQKEYLL